MSVDRRKRRNRSNKGFSLIELIVVIAVLAVLASVAGIILAGHIEESRETVCVTNRRQVEKAFELDNLMERETYESKISLSTFMLEHGYEDICPSKGIISITDDTLICSIHIESHEEDDGSVPYLYIP
ncbi:type II secretion system protein [Proteiniclasticum sp.]|uniref:type II secretion system protein n=1 Tax=Proteiniclasticum sp. TaxID=2053595 RepID=UPI00289EDC51|nr:type II secretion system protein [Proteiniclasticum sp.]